MCMLFIYRAWTEVYLDFHQARTVALIDAKIVNLKCYEALNFRGSYQKQERIRFGRILMTFIKASALVCLSSVKIPVFHYRRAFQNNTSLKLKGSTKLSYD